VIDLCKLGDGIVTDMCAQIYRAKKGGRAIEKGIAFPTCVSVNECVCHFSPLESDEPVR
jgi:methionine aminopeptidase